MVLEKRIVGGFVFKARRGDEQCFVGVKGAEGRYETIESCG